MCGAAYALRHLLLCLDLHVDESCAGLDGLDEPFFCNLHCLDLSALLGKFLQRRLCGCDFADAAGCYKRDVACEEFFCFLGGEGASVQTDFSHLTLLERFIYLLQIPVLYCCTNHVYFNNLTTSSTVMVYETTSPISRIRIKWTLPPSAFLSRLMISAISSMLYGHSG